MNFRNFRRPLSVGCSCLRDCHWNPKRWCDYKHQSEHSLFYLIYQDMSLTSCQHFIANEQESHRMPNGDAQSVSSNIDDQTMHELYLWPFQDAIRAGTANMMCSYQRINNSYGCANSATLNGLLKTELGFQGFVVSDWSALYTGVSAALSGLDVAMPNAGLYWGSKLSEAVRNGSVSESRLDDMVTR